MSKVSEYINENVMVDIFLINGIKITTTILEEKEDGFEVDEQFKPDGFIFKHAVATIMRHVERREEKPKRRKEAHGNW